MFSKHIVVFTSVHVYMSSTLSMETNLDLQWQDEDTTFPSVVILHIGGNES